MKRSVLLLCAGLAAALLAPAGAMAQRDDDWYRDVRPWLDRRSEEGAQRAELVQRYARLRSDVRTAERRGDISRREADRLYDRLDKVARFLRDDRHLSNSEYRRRSGDLDKVERDLRHDIGDYRYGRLPRRGSDR